MSEWRKHVKKVYDEMKKKDSTVLLKDALKKASKSWKKNKTQKKGGDCVLPKSGGGDCALAKSAGGNCGIMPEGNNMTDNSTVTTKKSRNGGMDMEEKIEGGSKINPDNRNGKFSKSKKSKNGGKTQKNKKLDDEDMTKPMYL